MESIDKLSERKWKKIVEAAEEYIGTHKPMPSKDMTCARMGLVSGRATCYEEDSG